MILVNYIKKYETIEVLEFLEKVIRNKDCEIKMKVDDLVSTIHSSSGEYKKTKETKATVFLKLEDKTGQFELTL